MKEYQTGAVRDTGGKGRFDLLPWCAIARVARHMEDSILPDPKTGVPHYPERNWERGLPMHSMVDSAFRHLAKYMMGMTDEDHLCAAATNLLMAMWTEENVPEAQDIPARKEAAKTAMVVENTSPYNNLEVCNCYMRYGYGHGDSPRCTGTKEVDHCSCGGDKTRCDLYLYGKE